jgi:hypothetical protein
VGRYHITPLIGESQDHPSWDSNGSRNYLGFGVSILVFHFIYSLFCESLDRCKSGLFGKLPVLNSLFETGGIRTARQAKVAIEGQTD